MSEWAAKRFWKTVEVCEDDAAGFSVTLDGRPVRTPAKSKLSMPSRQLAEWVAEEWRAQDEQIDPESMPITRAMNSALDKVTPQFEAVSEMLAAYGGSDLLCYRADAPEALTERQAAAWDPILDWARERFGIQWEVTSGLMPVTQPEKTVSTLKAQVDALSPFELTAFHDLVAMSGSLILALCVVHNERSPEDAWQLSRIDETWQIEQWGKDEEAEEQAEIKRQAFLRAAKIFAACSC